MAETIIEIPAPSILQAFVEIVGVTPLITNRPSPEAFAAMEAKQQKKAVTPREARDPNQEFLAAQYRDDENRCCFPAAGVKKAMVHAGGRFTEAAMTHLRGAINIADDLLPILAPAPSMRRDLVRLVGGKRSLAYRPQFWPWRLDIPVTYNAGVISLEQVVNLLTVAGFSVGIGDWRVEKNGIYGQFRVGEVRA